MTCSCTLGGAASVWPLLDAVHAAAQQRGALRLSLQTEPGNSGALRLYEQYGFTPITGLCHLMLDLTTG